MAIVQVSSLTQPLATVVAAPYGASGPLVAGTSNSTNVLDTVNPKNFVINEYNRSFYLGTRIRATAVGFTNVWMEGVVTAWDGETVTFTADLSSGGSGTYSNWGINVAGQPGVQGPIGPVGPIGPSGGPTGPQGPAGAPGSVWRNGAGAPPNALGANGDYYLDDANGNVWLRSSPSNAYAIVANIEGPTGLTGPAGAPGPAGATGAAGTPANAWHDGVGVPPPTLGANGDYYLNDSNGTVYNKQSGTWVVVATLAGPQGPVGPAGPAGPGTGDVLHTGTPVAGQVATWFDTAHIQGVAATSLGLAPLASPIFTGNPQAPTPATADNSVSLATTAFVKAQAYVTGGPYASLASPAFTGTPTAPTPPTTDNSFTLATTAYVVTANVNLKAAIVGSATSPMDTLGGIQNYINNSIVPPLNAKAPLNNPTFTGNPQAPTPAPSDNSVALATTAYVTTAIATSGAGAVNPTGGLLTFVSTTQLKFAPFRGARIKINGAIYLIPSAGIAGLANTGAFVNGVTNQPLAANTTYWVFAFMNAGVITADFRTAATHATSATVGNEGVEILTGDDTRTLIGMCRTGAGGVFLANTAGGATNATIGVLNWVNRRPLATSGHFTTDRSTASTTNVQINAEIAVNFLSWADPIMLAMSGQAFANASTVVYTYMAVDATIQYGGAYVNTDAGGDAKSIAGTISYSPTEGWHTATVYGSVGSGNTATWGGQTTAGATAGSGLPATTLSVSMSG